ncbi:MAG TPA: Mov34/MPN/PAD-1 family protein [Anaerolineales bacterium]
MATRILFAHPALEHRFRQATDRSEEVGGYLMVDTYQPLGWPGHWNERDLKKSIGADRRDWLLYVSGFVMAPNLSRRKKVEYSVWDVEKAQAVADQTASALGSALALHFHTHPNGSAEPSRADLAYAARYCQWAPGVSLFCVVTPRPLRLHVYQHRYGNVHLPDATDELTCGVFHAWLSQGLKPFRTGG